MLKFLIPLLFLSSCFRIGIPEKFYTFQNIDNTSLLPKVFIVKDDKEDIYKIFDEKNVKALGNQFILGLFPLTNLYLEHGIQSYFRETLSQNLISKGLVPILLPEQYRKSLSCPWIKIEPESSLRISAYDLLVTRLVKLSGNLKIKMKNGLHEKLELSNYDFYKQAYHPQLANFMQDETNKVLDNSKFSKYIQSRFCKSLNIDNALMLNFPSISSKIPEHFINEFNYQRFNKSMLARLVQRGAETALEDHLGNNVLTVLAGRIDAKNKLDIDLKRIEINKKNKINLLLEFDYSFKGMRTKKQCSIEQDVDTASDSNRAYAEVFAIEKAVYFSIEKLLSDEC